MLLLLLLFLMMMRGGVRRSGEIVSLGGFVLWMVVGKKVILHLRVARTGRELV